MVSTLMGKYVENSSIADLEKLLLTDNHSRYSFETLSLYEDLLAEIEGHYQAEDKAEAAAEKKNTKLELIAV